MSTKNVSQNHSCSRCGSVFETLPSICPRCGFDLAVWGNIPNKLEGKETTDAPPPPDYSWLKKLLLPADNEDGSFAGRAVFLLILTAWSATFLFRPWADPELGSTIMHTIDLVFHEAGHVIFIPLGRFMTVLGGSLGQLIAPLIVVGAFLFQHRDVFGAAIGLWWLGQSLMDLSPYIDDARKMELMLLGGMTGADAPGAHDWNNILSDLGMLKMDHALALTADITGRGLMVTAIAWAGMIIWHCYTVKRTA